ncbi:MAG: TetR/AcrR family transcriptional regulator [Acidimicrobiales bacterium]
MPTGIALPDAPERLFEAAERVLVRDGLNAVTSRSVTAEAGVAKGVLHRHFTDFDDFLAALVLDRVDGVHTLAASLEDQAGKGNVVENLTDALVDLFGPLALAIVALVISRDALRTRLREAGAARLPLLEEGVAMIRRYLATECDLGRVAVDADVDAIAPALIGAAHLLFTQPEGGRPPRSEVEKVVRTVVAHVLVERR